MMEGRNKEEKDKGGVWRRDRQTGRWRGMGREEHTAVKVGELEDRRKEADKIRVKGDKKDLCLISLCASQI